MPNAVSVTDINRYIKSLISFDMNLSHIWIRGEISNFKVYNSGHAYFSLKDQNSVLKCVMFHGFMQNVAFMPQNGMKVLAYGSINVYERDGVYQLYCEKIVTQGVGDLFIAYNELKAKLEQEGLFLEKYKKKIPYLPSSIAVVTSKSGAARHDIYNVIKRRFPTMNIKFYHVSVQGTEASGEISRTLFYISKEKTADVIILGRGGGSIEELWAFNEEKTARAIFNCDVPIISAVGHETDFTISDFVADMRAPTPSAAAELAVPEYSKLMDSICEKSARISLIPKSVLEVNKTRLEKLTENIYIKDPLMLLRNYSDKIDQFREGLESEIKKRCKSNEDVLDKLEYKLKALNPENVLSRGYSIVFTKNRRVIRSADSVNKGDEIRIMTGNGNFDARVD